MVFYVFSCCLFSVYGVMCCFVLGLVFGLVCVCLLLLLCFVVCGFVGSCVL